MHRRLLLGLLFAGCTATVQSPPPANPQPPPPPPPASGTATATVVVTPMAQKHPSYLHALTDLRSARAFLVRPAGVVIKWDENRAIREIDAAIGEIKQAAIDDGKPLEDHPPVDVGLVWGDRLHKALELVETARRDVNQEEDNAFARGLKNRAIGHIDLAARDINEGIQDAAAHPVVVTTAPPPPPPPPPSKHPAYLHALSDLRGARAFLERPAGIVVKWDEKKAIHEIDEAIREIKGASIDDGKPLEDHPPVDRPTWGGRLARAMELVQQARKDAAEEEDSPAIRQLRNRAEKHMALAEKFIAEGMEDAKKLKEPPPGPPPPPPPGPGAHPAYGAALGNLRHARALLEKPANADVKWDEQNGIREIDAAIKEIKDARMDDGVPMTEHPPIAPGIVYRDRLREAMKHLQDAARDIEGREDNGWAKPDRRRAVEHIRNAEHAVKEAVEERKEEKREKKGK